MCSLVGCSEKQRGNRLSTTGVIGQVTVDGKPVPADEPLRVVCNAVPTSTAGLKSQTLTGADGRFEISTYQKGDGVPPGDYSLTFFWGKMNIMNGSYDGPDRLKDKYQNSETSAVTFTVPAEGTPIDLGEIALISHGSETRN